MNGASAQLNVKKVNNVWHMLKLTYGLVPIVAGLDKFGFDFITHWAQYLNPMITNAIPLSTSHLLFLVGAIEIIAGIIVLSKWTRFGGYLVAVWLLVIVVNLVTMGKFYDIAVRDIVISIGAVALSMLTEAREGK